MRHFFTEKDIFKPGKVQIIGISPDPVEKQKVFVEKEKLTVLHIPLDLDLNKRTTDKIIRHLNSIPFSVM